MFKNVFLLVFLSTAVFQAPAVGQELVIMTGEWKPFVSADLDKYGFTAEVVRKACLAAGIMPSFQFAPWPRCEANVKHGKVFAAFPYTATDERSTFSHFSKPFSKSRTVFFYHKSKLKPFTFSHPGELKLYLIGGVRGYYYEPVFNKAGLSVDYSNNEIDSFKKLFHGRVDIVPLNELVGWETAKSLYANAKDIFSTTESALDESALSLMVSRKYPEAENLLRRFNNGLKEIQSTGAYKEIFSKYNIPESVGYFIQNSP